LDVHAALTYTKWVETWVVVQVLLSRSNNVYAII
jgi:hypothetical protein